MRDVVTGLYNRRYLEEALDHEIRRVGRAAQRAGLLMIDLEHFKRFNEAYGHDAGDGALREAASLLLKNVRAEDFVAVLAGENLWSSCPRQTWKARACEASDRVRK